MIKVTIPLLCCGFLFLTTNCIAQNVNGSLPVDGVSHTNGTKSNPGDDIVNVDLFTGIGTVTVPIYNYSVEGLDLGISLSYNTKGIQVDQIASSVGLGWVFNAGGEIARNPNALEDEIFINRKDTQFGGTLYKGAWTGFTGYQYLDQEYDYYNLSFGGRNLEMLWAFNDTNKVFTYPKSEISIRTILTDKTSSTYFEDFDAMSFLPGITSYYSSPTTTSEISFYLIDEKGNQFFFRPGDVETKDYKIEDSDSTARSVINRWVLTKVITNGGAEIKFNYQKKYLAYYSMYVEKVTEYFKSTGSNPPDLEYNQELLQWKGYVSQLSSIEYPNGVKATIHWDSSGIARCDQPGGYVVDSITLESKYDNNVKNSITYKLNYSYFHTPNSVNSNTEVSHRTACNSIESGIYSGTAHLSTRLKLKSIDRIGSDHSQSEKYYSFDYNSGTLPARFAQQKDFYGYSNNGSIVSIEIPSGFPKNLGIPLHTYNNNHNVNQAYGTNRDPDNSTGLAYIQACLLKKITNGHGGVVELNYSKPSLTNSSCGYRNNSYITNFSGSSGMGCTIDPELEGQNATDGLVVSSVLLRDGFSSDNDKEIIYEYAGGERFFRGGYFWIPTKVEGNIIKAREYRNHMVSEHKYLRGSNHGFSEVTVTHKNYQTQEQLGKNKYTFSNLFLPDPLTDLFTSDYTNVAATHYYASGLKPTAGLSCLHQDNGPAYHTMPPAWFEKFMMGLLKSVTVYDASNNIVTQEINKYDLNFYNYDSTIRERTWMTRRFYYSIVDANFNIDTQYTYKAIVTKPLVASVEPRVRYKKSIKKSGGRDLITEYTYEYDRLDNIKSMSWVDSKGDNYRKEYYYTYDYTLYDTALITSLQHLLIERTLKVYPTLPTYDRVLYHKVVSPQVSVQKNILPSSKLSAKFGNGVWFLSRLISLPNPSDSLLRYASKRFLHKIKFPSVYESTFDEPLTVASATSDENNAISGTVGLSSLKKVKEYTLRDDRNNILEVKLNELDRYNSFVWDSGKGHKIAEVNNARFNQIAYTSFEGLKENLPCLSDYGNWNLDQDAVVLGGTGNNPKALTGKYIYHFDYTRIANPITTDLQANTEYMLSFWADVPPKVLLGSAQLTLELKHTLLTWKLYTVRFNSYGVTNLSIMDNSTLVNVGFIDELRLHPVNATMTTYTYEPLFGVSSVCDERHNIMYTEYDAQGRASIVRDINGFIRAKTETKHQTNNN